MLLALELSLPAIRPVTGGGGAAETLTISQASPTSQATPSFLVGGVAGEALNHVMRVKINGVDYDDVLDAGDLVSWSPSFSFPALANSTSHTAQAFHLDASLVELQRSPVLTFTISDLTAPIIELPVPSVINSTTLRIAFSTNEKGGTKKAVASTSATQPLGTQVAAGQDHTGAAAPSGSAAVTATGAQTLDVTVSDFTPRYLHAVHVDAGGNISNVITTTVVTPYATPSELAGFTDWWDLGDENTVNPYLSGGGITRVDNKIGSVNLVPATNNANNRPLYNETVNSRKVAVFNNTGSAMNLGAYAAVPATLNGGSLYQYIVFKVATGGVDTINDTLFICTDPTNPRDDYSIQSNNASAFDGRLNLRELGTSQNFSPAGVSLGTTHLAEIEFAASTNIRVWIDNTLVATAATTKAALAATTMAYFLNGVNTLYGQLNESGFSTTLYRGNPNRAGLIAGINARWGTSFT